MKNLTIIKILIFLIIFGSLLLLTFASIHKVKSNNKLKTEQVVDTLKKDTI